MLEYVAEQFGSSHPGQHRSGHLKAVGLGRQRWLDHSTTLRPLDGSPEPVKSPAERLA